MGDSSGGDVSLSLAGEFATPTREQWLALVDGVLKGAPFDKLVTRIDDGVVVQPLYTDADDGRGALPGLAPFVRGARPAGSLGGWDVRQYHADPDPVATNDAILADLERGVTSIWLRVGADGVAIDALDRALDGVYLDLAPIVLEAGAAAADAADALCALWAARDVPPSAALGNFGIDLAAGLVPTADAVELARRAAFGYPQVRSIVVDGTSVNGRGGSDVDELGCVLAMGAHCLRVLTAGDANEALGLDAALAQLEFRLAATSDQFSTIAKMRAARRLWARVAEMCGATSSDAGMRQHAVTARTMLTQRDPWVNILRATVGCFAAGVGGADAITVLPFDDAIGLPDAFARRLARNTQAILVSEAHAARVVDPAGGSWYVESLTGDYARAAWAWFQQIEGAGGWDAAVDTGVIEQRLERSRDQRATDVARRRRPITGVTEFPDIAETRVTRRREPATAVARDAAPFERLRDRSDAAAARGARPAVFLVNIGPVAVHAARSGYAKTFFEIGGIAAIASEPVDDARAAAAAFAASGASDAVICSSDKWYETHAAPVAEALRAAGAKYVFLAGNPGDNRDRYAAAGIDEFIFIGCNALEVLSRTLVRLGVS
jgi:methylmalonyl-CoA mutase